jgi:hypothetical protein
MVDSYVLYEYHQSSRALARMFLSLNFPTPKERKVLLEKDFLPAKAFTALILRSRC